MKRMFKYELTIVDEQTIDLPVSAKFLSVVEQHGEVVLYALVDDEETAKRIEERRIRIVGTGHPFPDYEECEYLGTVLQHGGTLVWHIFEIK